jgi:DNA polymerase III delta subunit
VANAITLRDGPRALAAARSLVASGDEPLRIVGGLAYRARVLLRAKAMIEAGKSFRETTQATSSWRYADDLRRGVQSYTLAELLRFPSLLLEADRTLKSRGIQPGAVLENLVRRMTARSAPASGDHA